MFDEDTTSDTTLNKDTTGPSFFPLIKKVSYELIKADLTVLFGASVRVQFSVVRDTYDLIIFSFTNSVIVEKESWFFLRRQRRSRLNIRLNALI